MELEKRLERVRAICATMPTDELKGWEQIAMAATGGNKKAKELYRDTFGKWESLAEPIEVMRLAIDAQTAGERAASEARLTRELNYRASVVAPSDAQLEKWTEEDLPKLTYYRKKAGLTQKQLGDLSGVNIRQVQKIESAEVKMINVSLKNAVALADALKVDPRDLI